MTILIVIILVVVVIINMVIATNSRVSAVAVAASSHTRQYTLLHGTSSRSSCCNMVQYGYYYHHSMKYDGLNYESRRYKIDTTNMPPWRRWSTKLPNMGSSLHIDKKDDKMESMVLELRGRNRPIMVHPNRVKIATGDIDPIDMDDFTLAVTETVPFAYKYHHPSNRSRRVPDDIILQRISTRVNERLPDLNDAHMIKILLAFDRIRPKVIHRTAHPERYFLSRPLAYINQPFMTSLYQAIKPTSINNTKVLLALFTAYTRCGIHHPQWIRSVMDHACNTWLIDNTLPPTSPRELADIVLAFASTRVKKHDEFLHILTDEIEDNFNEFDEDAIGDVVRAFLSMRYGNKQFFTVLGRELPHRIHEYRWWNLIDIAELYMILKWPAEDDPDMIMRFGNEVWKYHKVMSGKYVARALRVLAYLETSDRRTFRSLIRRIPHHIMHLSPRLLAQCITAAAVVGHNPTKMYCRVRGCILYERLCRRLSRRVHEVGPHDLAQAVYSLMMVNSRQEYLFEQIVLCIMDDPLRFHLQQLAAFARAFKTLNFIPSVDILSQYGNEAQLLGCSIDALATVVALGSGKLQDTALDILTHIDGEDYHNNNGATTTTTTPIHECSCEDMMFILRGVSNNGTQVGNRVRDAFERYWLPEHYDTITAEELSWILWDIASSMVSSSSPSIYDSKDDEQEDQEEDITPLLLPPRWMINKTNVFIRLVLDRVIDDLTPEQCIRILTVMVWLRIDGWQDLLLPRITNCVLPNQDQAISRTLLQLLSVYIRLTSPIYYQSSDNYNNRVSTEVIDFCKWVDDTITTTTQSSAHFIGYEEMHLHDDDTITNKNYSLLSSSYNGLDWISPLGTMRLLRCCPFILPLALVNTSIVDVQQLHRARTFPQVRRILLCNNNDNNTHHSSEEQPSSSFPSSSNHHYRRSCGICLMPHTMAPPDVRGRLTLDCLRLLGWEVRVLGSHHDVMDITTIQQALQQQQQQGDGGGNGGGQHEALSNDYEQTNMLTLTSAAVSVA